MKHLHKFSLFESEDWDFKDLLVKINNDEVMKKWLYKADMDEDEMGLYYETVDLKTPYGETIKARFSDPAWEYTGDGWWNSPIYFFDENSGIKYECYGSIRSYGYPEDDGDGEWDGVYAEIVDPVKFCQKVFEIEPLIVARVYGLLREKEKEEVNTKLGKNLDSEFVRGANLLNKFGSDSD